MARKKITEELKEKVIEYYLDKPITIETVCTKFDLSYPTVIKILKDVPKYPKAILYSPELDEHYFDIIDNEHKAYFLGLIIADGNVFKDKSGSGRQASISITLDLEDSYILNIFKNDVKTTTTIGEDGRGCGQIAVRSNIMAQSLENYGITERKSFFTYLPDGIEEKYYRHLIRGIFDGDGSFQFITNRIKEIHSFSFCGTHRLMNDIAHKLNEASVLNYEPSVYDYKNRTLSEIKIQSINCIKSFGDWIYTDATVFLKRKKEKYDLFVEKHFNGNTEVTI